MFQQSWITHVNASVIKVISAALLWNCILSDHFQKFFFFFFGPQFHQVKKTCAKDGPSGVAPEGALDFRLQAPAHRLPPEEHGAVGA